MAGTRKGKRPSTTRDSKQEEEEEIIKEEDDSTDSEISFSDFPADSEDSEDSEAYSPSEEDGEEEDNIEEEEEEDNIEEEEEEDEDKEEIENAIVGYMNELETQADAAQNPKPQPEDSDSSEDEVPSRNTVGDVPLKWYNEEEHIGYDIGGKPIKKQVKKDRLDSFLAQSDDPNDWRKIYDEYNDEEVELTKEEIKFISRLRKGKIPHADVNPYEPYVDWFEWEDKGHPLSNAPEPKRRFIPSKWEAKKVVKLVRAIRKGWIKLDKEEEKPRYFLMWGDDQKSSEKMANGLSYIPPPKSKLPGHEESYNPSPEYVPTQEEINSYQLMYEEDRPKFIPKRFDSMRNIPAYDKFLSEMFERCLDLYLCPRTRKKRINIDPESLIPKLPKPKDLQPFPSTCFLEYRGHKKTVSCISVDPSGQWLASGSKDGSVRIWEVETARCLKVWNIDKPIQNIAWNPLSDLAILAVAVDNFVLIIRTGLSADDANERVLELLKVDSETTDDTDESKPLADWKQYNEKCYGIKLSLQKQVTSILWHYKGDYFATVTPDGDTKAVLVHQLSKQLTQNPLKKTNGRVVDALFHPKQSFFFLATKTHVRVYNLTKLAVVKKLVTGLNEVSSLAIHSGGDNLIVGSKEGKVCWFDMDLSTTPYRVLKNHDKDINAVAFHSSYPLFASCSDDCTAYVFHGMVYSDLLQNPLIVPLKVLRGHQSVNGRGILQCQFHPTQPWLFTAGADSVVKLYCN